MHFTINRDSFLKVLSKVQGIVEKKHTLPILANVLIEAKEDDLILTATDLEIALRLKLKTNINEGGQITVPAKKLYEIIKELPDHEIEFKIKKNYWIEISCGRSLFNIVGLSAEEFPKFSNISEDITNFDRLIIKEMIEKTIFSVSNEESKFNLTGIFLKYDLENEHLIFVSTDGHRLSMIRKKMDIKLPEKYTKGFILPKKGIIELNKLIDSLEENINIGMITNNFSVSTGDTILLMRLVDAEFPDYQRVIPEISENSIYLNREEFFHALKRISTLSNEKSKGVKININKNTMTLISSNPDIGDAKEELLINYDKSEISIGFNAKYIIDILQVLDSKNVILNLKDNIHPGRLYMENDDEFLAVIMPMRL